MVPPEMCARRVLAPACALALLLGAPRLARAEDADALIKQGVELRRAGHDEAALEQFRRAYDLAPTPRALAQMGLAEQALGRWIDGEAHLSRALEADDPWIAKYRGTLESSRAEIGRHLGSLFVTGGPEGAELRIDGQAAGTLPLRRPLRLPLGTFALEASVGGHIVIARAVSIAAGITAHEDLSAPATTASPTPTAATSPAARSATLSSGDAAHDDDGAGVDDDGRRRLAWLTTGGAVAFAAAGGVVLALGNHDAHSYNASCPGGQVDCADLESRGRREQVVGVVGLVAGGALGLTAAWLFLSEPARANGERRVACAPALDRWGASCALRF
jgi:hypothetical protein